MAQMLRMMKTINARVKCILYFRIFLMFYSNKYKGCRKNKGRGKDHLTESEWVLVMTVTYLQTWILIM